MTKERMPAGIKVLPKAGWGLATITV